MSLDSVIQDIASIREPTPAQHDPSRMSASEIEIAILDIVKALSYFDELLGLTERATFQTEQDKQQAGRLSALVAERIGWALNVFSNLKPIN